MPTSCLQAQLSGLEEVLRKVSLLTGRLVDRAGEEARDMAELARDLASIGSSASVFGDTDFFFEASREVARWGLSGYFWSLVVFLVHMVYKIWKWFFTESAPRQSI